MLPEPGPAEGGDRLGGQDDGAGQDARRVIGTNPIM
jgi:hypothetical protein